MNVYFIVQLEQIQESNISFVPVLSFPLTITRTVTPTFYPSWVNLLGNLYLIQEPLQLVGVYTWH